MKTFTAIILLLVLVLPLIIGVYWLLWQAWIFVMTSFGAPDKLANPSFWAFVLAAILLSWIGSMFRSK